MKSSGRDNKGRFTKNYVHPRKGMNTVKCICKLCGKEFYPKDFVKRSYCSKDCYYKNVLQNPNIKNKRNTGKKRTFEQRLKISGKNHYNWKGGISGKIRRLRNHVEWKEWRTKIFKRDKYTCQLCGQKGIYLHPHHFKSNTDFPEIRFDPNNGITICQNCHYLIHYSIEFKNSDWYIRKGAD